MEVRAIALSNILFVLGLTDLVAPSGVPVATQSVALPTLPHGLTFLVLPLTAVTLAVLAARAFRSQGAGSR